MDADTAIGAVLAAFGLAGAAGLNAWLPLFASALLDRLDVIALAEPFDRLSTTEGLVVLGSLLALDFVGDKVPAIDHALHAAGAVIAPISGAVLFTGQAGAETDIPTLVTVVAGGVVAEAVHVARALLRAASTATTGTVANPFLSLAEDGSSAAMTAVAFLAPILAVLLLAGLVGAGVVAWRRRVSRRARTAAP